MQSFQVVVLNSNDEKNMLTESDPNHRLLLTLFADSVSQYGILEAHVIITISNIFFHKTKLHMYKMGLFQKKNSK